MKSQFVLPLLVGLLAAQDPAPATATKRARLDVVELKNGDTLEGRITREVDGYVEVELEAGAIVGVSRAQVAAVRRGATPAPAVVASALRPRSEWFLLHDGQGASVGWLHGSVAVQPDGSATLSEEYEFVDGARRYQITSMCTADAALQPLTCYFRERVSAPGPVLLALPTGGSAPESDRITEERIVEASCRGDHLQVVRFDRAGRRERSIDWAPGTTFPLLARELARRADAVAGQVVVFDPATEETGRCEFGAPRQRRIDWDGAPRQVTEVAEANATGQNREWVDGDLRTLRREIAGPALVAVPSSADSARAMVGGTTIPGALVHEANGAFGLWAPNPAWRAVPGLPPGQVALVCAVHDASIGLVRLDHLDAGTSLDTAADAVANWFRLLHPDLRIERREPVTVRDRAGVRLFAGGKAAGAPGQATVDVIPAQGTFLVLVCRAPVASWDELAGDFAFVQRCVEIDPQAVAPRLQGPLADQAAAKGSDKAVDKAAVKGGARAAAPAAPAPAPAQGKAPAPRPRLLGTPTPAAGRVRPGTAVGR